MLCTEMSKSKARISDTQLLKKEQLNDDDDDDDDVLIAIPAVHITTFESSNLSSSKEQQVECGRVTQGRI